jgi:hypothetical protein
MTYFQISEDVSQGKKYFSHALKFFKEPKCGSHNKIMKKKKVGAQSLIRNTLRVGRRVIAPRWD